MEGNEWKKLVSLGADILFQRIQGELTRELLKNHINYSQFGVDTTNFNQTINFVMTWIDLASNDDLTRLV